MVRLRLAMSDLGLEKIRTNCCILVEVCSCYFNFVNVIIFFLLMVGDQSLNLGIFVGLGGAVLTF